MYAVVPKVGGNIIRYNRQIQEGELFIFRKFNAKKEVCACMCVCKGVGGVGRAKDVTKETREI